jgi:NAD(P)-dependent dehydrogenase (short-subunit alcohol dehydrogenase family)
MTVALITGASRGFGRAVATALSRRGWRLILDARGGYDLERARSALAHPSNAVGIPGDVTDPAHRERIAEAVASAGRLDLLLNNASELGPSPLPPLSRHPLGELEAVYRVNVLAPLALVQRLLPYLEASAGAVINVSSDAAVEAYEGWGGYGASKAALDQLGAVLAAEHPDLRVWAVDPGDMATDMQRAAFPGEDVGDRAAPESVVPALLRLVEQDLPSGRYRAAQFLEVAR